MGRAYPVEGRREPATWVALPFIIHDSVGQESEENSSLLQAVSAQPVWLVLEGVG